MGKYVRRITHKGKEMLLMDATGAGEEAALAAWEEMKQEVVNRQDRILVLVNAANIVLVPKTLTKATETAKAVRSHPGNHIAFVGMNSFEKTMTQAVATTAHLDVSFFKELDEGKDWLASEDDKRRKG